MLEKLTFNIRTDENEHATRKNRFLSNKWTREIRVADSSIFFFRFHVGVLFLGIFVFRTDFCMKNVRFPSKKWF